MTMEQRVTALETEVVPMLGQLSQDLQRIAAAQQEMMGLLNNMAADYRRLETRMGSLDVYMKAMAGKLLSPVELKQVDMEVMWLTTEPRTVAQPPP